MSHGNRHSPEQMRTHAQEVVGRDFTAISQPERDRLEVEYREEWENIRDNASTEANKLRLALYANLLDVDHEATRIDEQTWILNNVKATQILINSILGRQELVEDGIYGPATMRCVQIVFGLDIPVPSTDASGEIPAEGIILPAAILENEELLARMREAGILINGERAIVENPRLLEQFQEYLDLLNFIEEVERNPDNAEIVNKQGLIHRYISLINEGTDFLTQDLKEVLIYQYAEAIYNDVIRMGGYITRNGFQGEYTIENFETGEEMTDNIYMQVLREENTRNVFDVVAIASMSRRNFELNDDVIVGDASFVRTLLEQHEITAPDGNQIVDAQLLLMHREYVLPQIDTRITAARSGGSTSAQSLQELRFLRNYVESGEVQRVNYMRSILTQVNEYRGYLQHQATIDSAWTPERIANATEEDWIDFAADAVRGNAVGAFILGIFAWLMGKKNIAFTLMGLSVFSGTIADGIETVGRASQGVLSDSDLELVRMEELNYTLDNPDYQSAYETLAATNRTNITAQGFEVTSGSVSVVRSMDNERLYAMVNDITTEELEIDLSGSNSEVAGRIQAALGNNPDGTPRYTDEEVAAFVEILEQSGLRENGDETLLDVLLTGVDKVGHEYRTEWFGPFTEYEHVEPMFHDIFRDAWNAAGATRESRGELMSVIEDVEGSLHSGTRDTVTSVEVPNLADKTSRINDLMTRINASTIPQTVKDAINALLGEYVTLLTNQDALENLRSPWYNRENATRIALTAWTRGNQSIELENARTDIETKIGTLETLRDSMTGDIYTPLIAEINEEIAFLEGVINNIDESLVSLANYESITQGGGLDLSDELSVRRIIAVTGDIQTNLRNSIDGSTNDIMGALNLDFRGFITSFYRDAANTASQAIDISTRSGAELWNSMRQAMIDGAGSLPYVGTSLSGVALATLPSPIDPITNEPRILDDRTLEDIESEIRLALIEQYLVSIREEVSRYTRIEDIYSSQLSTLADPTSNPAGLTPDQETLARMLGSEKDALLESIRDEIERFAQGYAGAEMQRRIDDLDLALTDANLGNYESVARFLEIANSGTGTNIDTRIASINSLINTIFPDNADFLQNVLVPVSDIQTAFDTEVTILRTHVEGDDITNTDIIETLTSVSDIRTNIETLTRVQGIIGGVGTSPDIDTAIDALNERLYQVARVNEIPEVLAAIQADISTNEARIDELDTEISILDSTGDDSSDETTEREQRRQLLRILEGSIDSTPLSISQLKYNLENSYNIGATSTNFDALYMTVDDIINSLTR